MSRFATPQSPEPVTPVDPAVAALVPELAGLVRRVTGLEPVVEDRGRGEVRLSAPLAFSDGIGRGAVVAALFPYRGVLRVDVWVEHDRVFARTDGTPTGTRCYLNDFMASAQLAVGGTELPPELIRGTVAGVSAARDAVRRHNRRCESDWFKVRIASRPGAAFGVRP